MYVYIYIYICLVHTGEQRCYISVGTVSLSIVNDLVHTQSPFASFKLRPDHLTVFAHGQSRSIHASVALQADMSGYISLSLSLSIYIHTLTTTHTHLLSLEQQYRDVY